MENRMEWLRAHMKHQVEDLRHRLGDSAPTDSKERVVRFPNNAGIAAPMVQGEAVMELVDQAAAAIVNMESQAADIEARARGLARDAGERLRTADTRIQSLEAVLRKFEHGMNEANARVQEAEDTLKAAQERAAETEAEVYALEQRVNAAEMRADQSEQALARVEAAIRNKLLKLPSTGGNKRSAAA
jgi:predicted  nucleic acid-binding Zn-ribbon protein